MNSNNHSTKALGDRICTACRADAPRLSVDEIRELHKAVPEWELIDRDGITILTRQYAFKNFFQALAFTNLVGRLAESMDHHPSLLTEWGKVKVEWWTHKIKGLHQNDFVMAAKTENLFAAQSWEK